MNSMIRSAPAYAAPLRLVVVAAAHVLAVFVIAGALNLPKVAQIISSTLVPVAPDVPTKPAPPLTPANGTPALRDRFRVDPLPPPDADSLATETTIDTPPVGGASFGDSGSGPSLPQRVEARVDPAHPLSQPEYPAASVRMLEVGVVVLELNVGADGRVIEARVQQSSGHPRLDAAAVREALRRWRLLPATEDGQPVTGWIRQRVSFRLQDAD